MEIVTTSGGRRAAVEPTPQFEALYRAERPDLVRLAYLLVRSPAVAEELVHEAFIRLHRRWADVENPPGFLRTATVRLCFTWSSRQRMERDRLQLVPPAAPVPAADAAAADADELWAALGRLDPDRRNVLVLRYYTDLSHAEIAELTGCAVATVRTRVHRGLADLRKEIIR
jgi:RNA polymerase sigma-70 factor (sigma-E family)